VIAIRTCAENEFRAAQEFVTFPKGNQKSTFSILADQKFFHAVFPLRTDRFGAMREAGAARNFAADLESLAFPDIEFNTIKRVQWGTLQYRRAPEKGSDSPRMKFTSPTPLYGTSRSLRAMPKTTYRKSRIGLLLHSFWQCTTASCHLASSSLGLHTWIPRMQAGLDGTRLEPFPQDWSTIGARKRFRK
jgi:hypothetical protein